MIIRLNEDDLKRELAGLAKRAGGGDILEVFRVLDSHFDEESLIEIVISDPQTEPQG